MAYKHAQDGQMDQQFVVHDQGYRQKDDEADKRHCFPIGVDERIMSLHRPSGRADGI